MKTPTRKEKNSDLKRIISEIESISKIRPIKLSFTDYRKAGGKYSRGQIYSDGDSWGGLCSEVGIECDKSKEPIPDDEYFNKLVEFVEKFKRLPKTSERTKAGLNFNKKRWGTLGKFIEAAIDKGYLSQEYKKTQKDTKISLKSDDTNSRMKTFSIPKDSDKQKRIIPPPPMIPLRSNPKWERIDIIGMPYAPQDENAVIALFAILCHMGILKFQILDLNSGSGIDSICYDEVNKCDIRIEFKKDLSEAQWNHNIDDLDRVVCWKNKWDNFPKPVIELESVVKEYNSAL